MFIFDERNPRAATLAQSLRERLDTPLPEGLKVVIGGDGFMLRVVQEHDASGTFLGLNAGHLGFLLNDVHDVDAVLDALNRQAWTVYRFPLLQAKICCTDGLEVTEAAVNDVYLERSTGQTARLAISIDGHRVVDALVADGVVFATALGSTAYTFSAGGVAAHPRLRMLSVTPICPHNPRLSPFVLPQDARARVDVIDRQKRPVRAVADGRAVEDIESVTLSIGPEEVAMAYLEGHDFTGQMVSKILHP